MSGGILIVFLLGVTAGAVIQGSIGFGFSFVVVPLLGLLRPEALPATVLIMSMPMTVALALRERDAIDGGGFVRLTAGRVVGTAVGVLLVRSWPTDELAVLTGASLLLGVAVSLFAPAFEAGRRTQVALGVASGVMGTTAAVGGPPAALAYQHRPGPQLRATLSASFVIGSVLSLTGLALARQVGQEDLWLALELLPGLGIGLLLSRLVGRRLDRAWLRPAVLSFAAATAVAVLIRALT
jgi:uncharacterized membrane protein YfcA